MNRHKNKQRSTKKKRQNTHGAISVFLVIVLVPCLLVSSIFVDLGRVHMSKSLATSSSDVALNTLLTNYDADLSEWYGMVASCQDIESFYTISSEFFLRSLSSQNLDDDEIILLSDYFSNAIGDDTIYDLLKVESQTETNSIISEIEGANLANATMLKDQVVEFMKYRAPIELTLGVIERLKNEPSLEDAMEYEENEKLVKDKTTFYETDGEFRMAAYKSYLAIMDYYTCGLTNQSLSDWAIVLNACKMDYKIIHTALVTCLFNTGDLEKYTRPRPTEYTTYSRLQVCSDWELHDNGKSRIYYIYEGDLLSYKKRLSSCIADFKEAVEEYERAIANLMTSENYPNIRDWDDPNSANAIQWWVQMDDILHSKRKNYSELVENAAANMLSACNKLDVALACIHVDVSDSVVEDCEDLLEDANDLESTYLTKGATGSGTYLKAVNMLEQISSLYSNHIDPSKLMIDMSDGETRSFADGVAFLQGTVMTLEANLKQYDELLDIAINGNGDDVKSLDALADLAEKYQKDFQQFKTTAENTTTTMGDDVRKNELNPENMCEFVTRNNVNELKTRLSNIRSQIKGVLDLIDKLKYGSKKLSEIIKMDITSKEEPTSDEVLEYVKDAAKKTVLKDGIEENQIPLKNSDLTAYAEATWAKLFSPQTDPVYTLEHMNDTEYNLLIDPKEGDVDTPELFMKLYQAFESLRNKEVEIDSHKKSNDNGKVATTDQGNAAKNTERYHGGGENITPILSAQKEETRQQFNLLDGAVSGILDLFNSLKNGDVASIRDDLYVTSYIMDMFTYATYEEEGIYSLMKDEEKTALMLPSEGHRPQQYEAYLVEGEKMWLSTEMTDFYNKSLTNKMLTLSNNVAYGAEVEYILYGGRDGLGNSENVKSVYSNIFSIRYLLNLVSGFANFWSVPINQDNITAKFIGDIADTIQIITSGIIPAPVTKLVLIPLLTVFETSKDLRRLEAGFPVELYKQTHENWWIKVSVSDDQGVTGFTNVLSGDGFNGPNTNQGLYYSDYLTIFVYLGLKSDAAESMYLRIADVIQANMQKVTGSDTYSLTKSRLYFKLEATLRVKPLMVSLPIFSGYENDMDTQTDWCTYTISTVRGYP